MPNILCDFQYDFLGLAGKNDLAQNCFHRQINKEFFKLPIAYDREKDGELQEHFDLVEKNTTEPYTFLTKKRKEFGINYLEEIAALLIQDEIFTCDQHKTDIEKHINSFSKIFYGLDEEFDKIREEPSRDIIQEMESWIHTISLSDNPQYTLPKEIQEKHNRTEKIAKLFRKCLSESDEEEMKENEISSNKKKPMGFYQKDITVH